MTKRNIMKEPFWEETYKLAGYKTFGDASSEIISLAKSLPTNANILDVGCGDGRNSLYLSSIGHSVDAFDISSNAVRKLRFLAEQSDLNIDIQESALQDYIFKKEYDLIISSGVYQFVDKRIALEFMKKTQRHTKVNGYHFVVVFIDTLPIPEEIKEIAIGLYHDKELSEIYSDWETVFFNSYEFEDNHPNGIHHRHAANKYVGKKLAIAAN